MMRFLRLQRQRKKQRQQLQQQEQQQQSSARGADIAAADVSTTVRHLPMSASIPLTPSEFEASFAACQDAAEAPVSTALSEAFACSHRGEASLTCESDAGGDESDDDDDAEPLVLPPVQQSIPYTPHRRSSASGWLAWSTASPQRQQCHRHHDQWQHLAQPLRFRSDHSALRRLSLQETRTTGYVVLNTEKSRPGDTFTLEDGGDEDLPRYQR
ncbi:hypothetical protein RI367_007630 [Sorochytrium milnesiophthora]